MQDGDDAQGKLDGQKHLRREKEGRFEVRCNLLLYVYRVSQKV